MTELCGPGAAAGERRVHTLRRPARRDGIDEGPSLPAILQLAVSADAQWCATRDGDHKVRVYSLDVLAFHATVPLPTQNPSTSPKRALPSDHAPPSV